MDFSLAQADWALLSDDNFSSSFFSISFWDCMSENSCEMVLAVGRMAKMAKNEIVSKVKSISMLALTSGLFP